MNRAERRRAARESARSLVICTDPEHCPGSGTDDWVIFTSPGCDDERHRLEVFGAMIALQQAGPWQGETVMDCGCTLSLVRTVDVR